MDPKAVLIIDVKENILNTYATEWTPAIQYLYKLSYSMSAVKVSQ